MTTTQKIISEISSTLGLSLQASGASLHSVSPIDGSTLGQVPVTDDKLYEQIVTKAHETFLRWRQHPAPARGEIVRQIGEALRKYKEPLGKLVTLETGKILQEGLGEIQECIDIADFAVGLSRQLYGKTMHSERPSHRMYEQWHPLGIVGVITAFNFPAAVWAWNAMLAAVCGDVILWKPSELTPLTAVAMNKIADEIATKHGFPNLFNLVISQGKELGVKLSSDKRIPLVSATGSCVMGRSVAETVGKRLGKTILELGGNNAIVILKDADLSLVIPSVLFGAVGTAGQRCTSTRRLLVEKDILETVSKKLVRAYAQVRIGNPLDDETLMGPLITKNSVTNYLQAIEAAKAQGGTILVGGGMVPNAPSDRYVLPTIIQMPKQTEIVKEETFAPILYIIPVKNLEDAVSMHNEVPQGLSSAIFTRDIQAAERFLSATGSDCGIANVNIGTSGAEIGGAFGGEKDTGGGRESGSDSWKQYMRRQTNTINYSDSLPLAQGIKFDVGT